MLNMNWNFKFIILLISLTLNACMLSNILLQKLQIVRKHKLIFCTIDKVASTSFSRLLNLLAGKSKVSSKFPWGLNSPKKTKASKLQIESYLKSSTWVKVVFFREPLERFVSGYISKCGPQSTYFNKLQCLRAFGLRNATFSQAIDVLSKQDYIKNSHWAPQHMFCGGLNASLKYYNNIRIFDERSLSNDVIELFTRFNFTEGNSQSFLSDIRALFPIREAKSKDRKDICKPPKPLDLYYSDPKFIRAVVSKYHMDYSISNISIPCWAQTSLQILKLTT